MPKLPYPYQKKEIELVLPRTFFLDAFTQYRDEDTIAHLKKLAKINLIAEIIVRKRASIPTTYLGATSPKAFGQFQTKIGKISPYSELNLTAFKEALFIDETPGIQNLEVNQSAIAVADNLLKTGNINPIIVVRENSVKKWKETYVREFYKRASQKKLAVFSVDQTLEYLKEKENTLYDSARSSMENNQNSHLRAFLP